jgi:hypothetical protein
MADAAKRRVEAISKQLAPAAGTSGADPKAGGIPPIHQFAPDSGGDRVAGKVVIITGKDD